MTSQGSPQMNAAYIMNWLRAFKAGDTECDLQAFSPHVERILQDQFHGSWGELVAAAPQNWVSDPEGLIQHAFPGAKIGTITPISPASVPIAAPPPLLLPKQIRQIIWYKNSAPRSMLTRECG